MPAKDLMFKIAIYDDTKAKLDEIKKNLSDLDKYALGVSTSVLVAVRSIKELGTGFKLDVPELSTFAKQINEVERALNRGDAFKVTELKNAMETIKKFNEQIGGDVIKGGGVTQTMNLMASQLEAGAMKMGSASMASLETYRDQLGAVSKEIESNINNVRTRIANIFESSPLQNKQAMNFRAMFGFSGSVSDQSVLEFVKKFEDAISHVQERLKVYDKSILNNQYFFGDIGKIKQELETLETAVVAVRNGLSGKSLLGSMPENTSAKMEELSNIVGKIDVLEQKLKTFGNGTYPDVMRGFLEAVNGAVSEVEKRVNGLSGAKIQQGASQQTTAGSQQLNFKFDEHTVLDPLNKVQQTIAGIIERIKTDISDGLKDALNTDLSSAKAIQSLNEFAGALSSLEEKMRSLYGVAGKVKDILGDLRGVQENMSAAANGGNIITPAVTTNGATPRQTEEIKENTKSTKENKRSKEEAAAANAKLAAEESTVANAMGRTSAAAKNQSQILSDLKSMAAQYLSVWGAKQFITDMANITGELELQKKSLEVILGSGTAATEMYMQLRDLSQRSPYTFEDLLKSHRQLAAFGIEAKDIYGTMKSLTDIGAGLDVDVSRLILAYGHTRSYGYLSGIQNRQFETAGIDLVGALSDLYNRRADEARSKGQTAQYRSRRDIFGLMRKREIPFEDVEEVIMDLDKPGGRFYNMQERQYDTLGGKIRNLRNNYRIMMSEMGGSNHGVLMGGVDMLNELTEHWEKYVDIIKDVAIALGAAKVTQLAFGKAAATSNVAMSRVMMSTRTTAFLNSTDGKWESVAQDTFDIGSSNDMTAKRAKVKANQISVKDIAMNREMNSLTKQRIALTADLTKSQRALLLASTGIDKAQARQLARLSPLQRRLLSVAISFRTAAVAVRAFGAAMLSQAAVMAPIIAITELVSHVTEQSRKAEELAKSFREESGTNRKTAEEILQNYGENGRGLISVDTSTKYSAAGDRIDTNKIKLNRDENGLLAGGADLSGDIEELKRKLQVLSPLYNGDLLDINKMETQEQQFEVLVNKIESIRKANQVQEAISTDLANADKRVAGETAISRAFGDTFGEDMQDYMETLRDMRERVMSGTSDRNSTMYVSDQDFDAIDAATGGMLTAIKNSENLSSYREALAVMFDRLSKMTKEERNKYVDKMNHVNLKGSGYAAGVLYQYAAQPMFGKNLETQYEQARADVVKWSRTLGEDVIRNFVEDKDGAVAAMVNSVNSFMASYGITDTATMQSMVDMIVASLKSRSDFKVGGSNIGDLYAEAIVKDQFSQYLKGLRGDMSADDAKKIFEDAYKKIEEFMTQHGIVIRKKGKQTVKEWLRGLYEGQFDSLKAQEAWQKRALDKIVTNNEIKSKITTSIDIYEFAGEVTKKLKEARDKVEKMIPHIKALQVKMGINFDISASTSTKEIDKLIANLQKKTLAIYPVATQTAAREMIKQLQDFKGELSTERELSDWLKSEGFKDEDQEKRNKKNDDAARKREQADRKHDQDLLKRLQDRQKAIQKAYEWYNRWYGQLGNADAAMNEAKELVNASDIKGIDLNALKTWETFAKLLERVREETKKEKANIRIKENRERIDTIVASYTDQIDRGNSDEFTRNQERASSALDKVIDRLGKEYDLYKKIYELTGNREMASQLSGRSLSNSNQSKADDVRDAIQSNLNEARARLGLSEFDLSFDRILNMDDETIKRTMGTILNIDDDGKVLEKNRDLAVSYKAIVNALTKWRDLQEQINNEGAETYATIIGSVESYDNVIKKLNEGLHETIDKLQTARDNGVISQSDYERGVEIKTAQTDLKKYEATATAQLYMGAAVNNMTRSQANRVYDAYIDELNNAFKKGAISAKDYADKVKKVNEQYGKINTTTSDTTAMITGGLDGLFSNRQQKAQFMIDQGAQDYKKYQSAFEEANKVGDYKGMMEAQGGMDNAEAMSKQGSEMLKGANSAAATVAIIDKVVKTINANVQSLKAIFDDIANSVDALGGDAEKFKSSGGYAFVSGLASASQGATDARNSLKSGNAMGVLEGGYRSIMAFPEAFARAHDERRQRTIEKIQQDVSKIEGYTEIISKARERTLGYDYGNVIRGYQSVYARSTDEGAAGKAMTKYYGSAGADTDLSGYQQQYNMLLQKREDYIDMYNEENDKKKKSNSALEEYKQKIAEIDDQIRYFSQDLANSLYGIDIKGWADQIGDAIMTAFENGEDAADAFKDTVTSILQDLTKRILIMGMIQPMLQGLQDELFGYTDDSGKYHEGVFNPESPEKSVDAVISTISKYLGDDGIIAKKIPAIEDILNGYEEIANKNGNNTLLNSNSATMSSSIKGISEQTADLLAAYLNAIRADVSVIRQVQALFYQNAWPDYIKQVAGGISYLQSIDGNTRAIRDLISENGALFNNVRDLRNDMHRLITHQETIKVG